jgi:hypothetical protein
LAERAKVDEELLGNTDSILPADFLKATLNNRANSRSERLRAAETLMKYPAAAAPEPIVMQLPRILSVPRYSVVDLKDGTCCSIRDGTPLEYEEHVPFTASPPLSAEPQRRPRPEPEKAPAEAFETAEATPPANVTPLRPWTFRRNEPGGDDGQGAA